MDTALLNSFRTKILEEGAKLVPKYGFKNSSLMTISIQAFREKNIKEIDGKLMNINTNNFFPRGFSIALVEHIVYTSNKVAYERLENCFNKSVILKSISKNSELYSLGKYKPPGVKNVVEEAMLAKFNALMPYVDHWPDAVSLEWKPNNVPFAIKNVAEFVDTTCYYAERMENLGIIIKSGNILLQSRLKYSFTLEEGLNKKSLIDPKIENKTDEEQFWHYFTTGIPLSSSPSLNEGSLSYDWYFKRTKVATVFSLGMLSFLGEEGKQRLQTKEMVKRITDRLL